MAGNCWRRSAPRVRTGTGGGVGDGATTVVGVTGTGTVVEGAGGRVGSVVATGGAVVGTGVVIGGAVTIGGDVGVGAGSVVPGAPGDGDTGVGGAACGATKVNARSSVSTWLREVVNRTATSTVPTRATGGASSVSRLPVLSASTTARSPNQT